MGILRTPGEIAKQLPTPTLFIGVWILGGLYALLGALTVAELGAMIPRSGGWYVFVHRALGNYPGFVVGWSDWLSTCGTLAVIAMVVGEYTAVLIPRLAGRDKSIALAVTLAFAALQWRGIRWGSFTQNVTSLLKTLIFAVIAIAAFTFGGNTSAGTALPTPHGFALFGALIIALQGVLYTYDGWYGVIYFGEEVRDPKRDVVRSMLGGVLLIIAIYLVVNLAYVYVLPMSQLAGENFAAGAVANKIFGAYGDKTIRVLAILSLLSTINAYTLTAPRILYAMSCDELFARRANRVNKGGTPTVTLFISTVVAVLFISFRSFEQVLAALAFFFVANYTMAYLSLIVLRRREPDLPRPYRAWGYPWTTGIVLLGSIAFLAGAVLSDKRDSLFALAILAVSVPIYLVVRLMSSRHGQGETG
ncbi:MAG: basic amino acid/polyamine antiporter, family [Blastocatellia bacterium]|jgi:APA family basic amino acid/polyamine antiporter|nr:basic amino acid/polyamine antiporter, family [Blastocatellia bacterium]